ncbi:MAG: insulinase family protein [Proteobacteria bacterium]|nr:insulinase family protein [Pseudomonadota bacterium]
MNMRAVIGAVVVAACGLFAPAAAFAADAKAIAFSKGTDVWFMEDHTVPMIAMVISLPAGSAYDPNGKDGLASYASSLMDEGAGNLDSNAYQSALNNRAIKLAASAERDYTVVSLITLTENAPEAFRLLGLALAHPRFDAGTVARVRSQIVASLQDDETEPETVAAKAFFGIYFNTHPYAHSVSGTIAGVSAINVQDLKIFARTHWVRGGMKVAVSGDLNEAKLRDYLKIAIGSLPAQAPPWIQPVGKVGAPGVHVIPMPVPQPNLVFGVPGVLRNDKDFIPAYVANYILGGGGFSSRLTSEVREKRGLTYGISTSVTPFRKTGIVLGEMATKRESVRQSIQVIRDTMKTFMDDGVTDKELADAKTYLTGSFPLAFTSNAGIVSQLSAFQRAGLGIDYLAKRNALINAVTLDDVQRVAKRLFNPARLTIVVAGTPAQPQESQKGPQNPQQKAPAKPTKR